MVKKGEGVGDAQASPRPERGCPGRGEALPAAMGDGGGCGERN